MMGLLAQTSTWLRDAVWHQALFLQLHYDASEPGGVKSKEATDPPGFDEFGRPPRCGLDGLPLEPFVKPAAFGNSLIAACSRLSSLRLLGLQYCALDNSAVHGLLGVLGEKVSART